MFSRVEGFKSPILFRFHRNLLVLLSCADLFERAWGWDTILPFSVARTFSRYKEYLVDYYNRNQKKPNAAAAAADLTGDDDSLTALANKVTFLYICHLLIFFYNF